MMTLYCRNDILYIICKKFGEKIMAARKKTRRKSTKQKEELRLKNEITLLISFALCVFFTISNFGIAGFIGDMISAFLFGMFGMMAYIVPVLVFVGIAFMISNKGSRQACKKVIFGVVLIVMLCTLFQLVSIGYLEHVSIFRLYARSSMQRNGGGMLGGMVVNLLAPAIGIVGTYLIVIILCIVSFVIMTEKSFLQVMRTGGEKAYHSAKNDVKRRKEQREKIRKEKEKETENRKDHVVTGVSFDTTLEKKMPAYKSPEIQEITPPEDLNTEDLFQITKQEEVMIDRVEKKEEEYPKSKPAKDGTEKTKEYIENVEEEIQKQQDETGASQRDYQYPPLSLLTKGKKTKGDSDSYLRQTALKLQETLHNFNVNVSVTNVSCGPSVTRFEIQPEQGVKVSKIVGLADDIKLNLAAADIRIEAPIPGKAAVGIEVPNKENTAVMLRDLLESKEFQTAESKLSFAAGCDIAGKVVVTDIAKMPHVLIAGATGSGKSVCINTIIMSILYKAAPDEVKLIMIDPKVVELSVYNGIPHLLIPVVTDPKKASGALNWAVMEMTKRYQLFAEYQVRDLKGYNDKIEKIKDLNSEPKPERLPQIVIIVDELADLMMVAPGEVEEAICRLAQLARACGIHLILATQRPSVNVITGLIKANMPSRIAFSVSSGVDSRTIIDMNGAEKLLGRGDMLFYPSGYQKPARVQGAFVSDKEVQAVVEFLKQHSDQTAYNEELTQHMDQAQTAVSGSSPAAAGNERDVYFVDAGKFVIEKDKASIGMLQRVFKIGFNRAARIMDQLAEAGVVGEEEGTKPRKVLMSMEEFLQYIDEYV